MTCFVMGEYGVHLMKAPRLKRLGPCRVQDVIEIMAVLVTISLACNPPPIGRGGKTGFPNAIARLQHTGCCHENRVDMRGSAAP